MPQSDVENGSGPAAAKDPQPPPYAAQKRFFEIDAPRLATRLFGNPQYPRNIRKKCAHIVRTLAGCERVLEVGTGRGLQLGFLLDQFGPRTRFAGVDVAHTPLTTARAALSEAQRERALLATALAETLPFADASFDGVFCLDVLHHATSQAAMLAEMRRVLRPQGRLICVEPNPRYPVNVIYRRDPIEHKLFDLTPANAREWARTAGLCDVRLTNFPVFFPSFPAALEGFYDRAENLLGRVPILRRFSTTLVLTASRPTVGAERAQRVTAGVD